jgi:hypothetical protein
VQQFLLLWPVASRNEKGSDLNIGHLATRGKIRLMPDEHPTCVRIEGEQPPIAVGAVVNLSSPNGHANCSVLHALEVGISPIKWKRPLGYAPSGLSFLGFELLDECSESDCRKQQVLIATGIDRSLRAIVAVTDHMPTD